MHAVEQQTENDSLRSIAHIYKSCTINKWTNRNFGAYNSYISFMFYPQAPNRASTRHSVQHRFCK